MTTKKQPRSEQQNPYRLTKKALPEGAGGQKRAVYEAIRAGATSAIALRDAVRTAAAFKGVSDETLKNNAAFHVARLRRDGFIAKGAKR